MKRLILSMFIVALAGCATLSKEECRQGNWHAIGLKDGMEGEPAARLALHREACSEYGVRPDERSYLDGRTSGLQSYCQLENAIATGLRGETYHAVCPHGIDGEFRRRHSAAYAVYEARSRMESIESSIRSAESRLHKKNLDDKSRDRIHSELHALERQYHRARDDYDFQQRQLDRLLDQR
jgi:hypothetical protein